MTPAAELQAALDAVPDYLAPAETIARIAEGLLDLGVRESDGQNRGPHLDEIFGQLGIDPRRAPAWCAYVNRWIVQAAQRKCEVSWKMPTSGSAVRQWHKADPAQRILREDIKAKILAGWSPRGCIYVRTRTSAPPATRDHALVHPTKGHTGAVLGHHFDPVDSDRLVLPASAGNSAGDGHDNTGTGAYAREVIAEGGAAWLRLLGLIEPQTW